MVVVDNLQPLVSYLVRRTNERAFVVGTDNADVTASGGLKNLHLENPSDSGVSLEVEEFIIDTDFRGRYWIHDQFSTAPNSGTTRTVQNLRMDSNNGSPDSGSAAAAQDVSYTESGTHFEGVIPGGGGDGSGIGTTGGHATGTEPIIDPGREIVIEIQNDSANERPGSIGVVYTEADA